MTAVRLLIGTQKGAFTATSDGTRQGWALSGPLFGGWEVYHVAGSPVEPDRLYASQSSGWFGQILQRSDDGGVSWRAVGNTFSYTGEVGTHQWYDGTPHPWEFARVWHLEPSATDPDAVLAGVEDAALFRTTDGGGSWSEVAGLRSHPSGSGWQPGAGGMAVHTILVHPDDPRRIHVAISAA
ncbi:MAG: WD40/YVTN/BNR-like repeat-containing protein, partial [Acidimicrobiales bacterium]